MKYSELRAAFYQHEETRPEQHLTAIIVFTEDSFDRRYPRLSRSYITSSNNKAYQPNMSSYSVFASCLDGTDQGVRLEWYMEAHGNTGGWKVEDCYILEQMRDAAAIPSLNKTAQDDGTVCYFFGGTTIRAEESIDHGKLRLKPVAGDQVACGEWTDLDIDQVAGYCVLLERHLNREAGGS